MGQVLFICTGNLCRSPSAEWFLTQLLQQYGPHDVTAASAGIVGSTLPTPHRLIKEGAAFGMDLADHAPRRVEPGDIGRSDLVIGMAREHVRELVLLEPSSFPKMFTLRELVRRGQAQGRRRSRQSWPEWLELVGGARRPLDMIGDAAEDDISDPMGGRSEDFRLMLGAVATLTKALHSLAWP